MYVLEYDVNTVSFGIFEYLIGCVKGILGENVVFTHRLLVIFEIVFDNIDKELLAFLAYKAV